MFTMVRGHFGLSFTMSRSHSNGLSLTFLRARRLDFPGWLRDLGSAGGLKTSRPFRHSRLLFGRTRFSTTRHVPLSALGAAQLALGWLGLVHKSKFSPSSASQVVSPSNTLANPLGSPMLTDHPKRR